MTRKPPDLPNIEDATLRACLAPLMDAMNAPPDVDGQAALGERSALFPDQALSATEGMAAHEAPGGLNVPATLAEWRQTTDEDFDAYRTIERFLSMTDADLETAAAAYPRQFAGTAARIARIKDRLEAHYEAVAAVQVLLRRALDRSGRG